MEQTQTQVPPAHERSPARHTSVISLVSFYGAAVFGVGTIFNNIRQKFHQNFVLGYGETRTPFTEIVERYNGKQFMPKDIRDKTQLGLFDKISIDAEQGLIDTKTYLEKRAELSQKYRGEINTMLMKDFGIPTERKLEDWTIGTWKRWKLLGNTSRIDASLGFASVTAFSVAAISLLHHNRRMLERVEKDIDERVR